MANCIPTVNLNIPNGPSGPSIPGFGQSFAYNGFQVVDEKDLSFKVLAYNEDSQLYDRVTFTGDDGYIYNDGYGKIAFFSDKAKFLSNDKKIKILTDSSNEGTFNIAEFDKTSSSRVFLTKDYSFPGPPNLNFLFEKFSLLIPGGKFKSPLNPNYGKDTIDQVVKLFDMFMPFITMYKFFLPILKLILCILEVFCAMPNPIKVAAAMQRLFRDCVPLFLSLFPIIALILMIITILALLIQIINYLILLIFNLIELIIKNINIYIQAVKRADEESILAAASKIGRILCVFQNLLVVLSMVDVVIQIFKDILQSIFSIPPCDDSENSSFQNCCTPDVCPKFIKNGDFNRVTGSMQYVSSLSSSPDIPSGFESLAKSLTSQVREESFQFFDSSAELYQELINIVAPKDPSFNSYAANYSTPPIFFPSDSVYNATTAPNQSPYLVDLKLLYNPADFGRSGIERYVTFKDCIVINPTSAYLIKADNSKESIPTGVVKIVGGKGFEEDGSILYGYDKSGSDIHAQTEDQATLETFIFVESQNIKSSTALSAIEGSDFINFKDIQYKFRINHTVLVSKNIITYSCMPNVNRDRAFTNAVFSNDLNLKIAELQNFKFPDINKSIDCINLALDAFRNNVTADGADTLKSTMIACLQQLQQETEEAINNAIPLAFDQYKSTFTVQPKTQFTTDKIKIQVDLKESSGTSLVNLLPPGTSEYIAKKIIPTISFGEISKFTYNNGLFEAEISSNDPGSGIIEIAFENKKISDINPINRVENLDDPLTISVRQEQYQFIYVSSMPGPISVGTGDSSDGQPRRDGGDIARQSSGS